MGTRAAPSVANIFCAEIHKEIVKLSEKYYDKTRRWTPPTCPLPASTASSRRTRGTSPGRHRPAWSPHSYSDCCIVQICCDIVIYIVFFYRHH